MLIGERRRVVVKVRRVGGAVSGRPTDARLIAATTVRAMRFGRSGTSVPGKHRGIEPVGPAAPDTDLECYLTAISPARDPEITDGGRKFGSAQVHQLRLPSGVDEKVQFLARQRGTSAQSLLQEWVMQRVLEEFTSPDELAERRDGS